MHFHPTFGAFLVAVTMVHGAPLLVERRVDRTGNMTANAKPTRPVGNFRGGSGGFQPGFMQGVEDNTPSAGGSPDSGKSDNSGGPDEIGGGDENEDSAESGGANQDEGLNNGGDSTAAGPAKRDEAKKAKKPQGSTALGGKPVGGVAGAAATIANIGNGLVGRQNPTSQGAGNVIPQGGSARVPKMSPGVQSNGDNTNPGRTSAPGNGVPGGSKNGSPQPPAGTVPFKRDTPSTGIRLGNVKPPKPKAGSNPNQSTSVKPNQPSTQGPSGQTSSNSSGGTPGKSVGEPQKAPTQAAPNDEALAPLPIKGRAVTGTAPKSGSCKKSPCAPTSSGSTSDNASGDTSGSSETDQSSDQAPKKINSSALKGGPTGILGLPTVGLPAMPAAAKPAA